MSHLVHVNFTAEFTERFTEFHYVRVKPRFQGHYSLLFLLPFIVNVQFATAGGLDSRARSLGLFHGGSCT